MKITLEMIEGAREAEFQYYAQRQILAANVHARPASRCSRPHSGRSPTRLPQRSSRQWLSKPGSHGPGAEQPSTFLAVQRPERRRESPPGRLPPLYRQRSKPDQDGLVAGRRLLIMLARAYAEHVRGEMRRHLDVDCRICKPGSLMGDTPGGRRALFWVNSGQFGIAKVHRADCYHCRAAVKVRSRLRMATRSPFDDYPSARAFAQCVRSERWDHLDVDCRICKPGWR